MKRKVSVLLIAALMIVMMFSVVALAEDDHGADAHSPSMSYESGETPIEDESTTIDSSPIQEGDEIIAEDEEVDSADQEDVEPEETEESESSGGLSVWIYLAGGAVVLIAVIAIAKSISSRA